MPPKQPSYLDMLKEGATGFFTDPTFTVPTGVAALTAGINYGAKKLGPGFASKAIPAVGAAVKRAGDAAGEAIKTGARVVRPAIRTYMPALNNAIDAAKVSYDWLAPKAYLAAKSDIGKPFANAYNAVAKSPVGKGIATGTKFIGKGINAVDKTLYSGVGGKAHRTVDAVMAGSPLGDPWFEEAAVTKGNHVNSILRTYDLLSKPGYLDNAVKTEKGEREAKLMLMTLEDAMNQAGLPKQVKDHFYAALTGNGMMANADRQSLMGILNQHVPIRQQFDDPTFRGGGQPSVGDLLTIGTFGANNLVNSLSNNAFPWMADKQAAGDMAMANRQNFRGGRAETGAQRRYSGLEKFYQNEVKAKRMTPEQATRLLANDLRGIQAQLDMDAKNIGLR